MMADSRLQTPPPTLFPQGDKTTHRHPSPLVFISMKIKGEKNPVSTGFFV